MYSPLHAAAGMLLSQAAPNPIAAVALGIGSHYLLDAIPHGDTRPLPFLMRLSRWQRLAVEEAIDLPSAVILTAWLIPHLDGSVLKLLAGALGGILPDILWGGLLVLEKFTPRWTWLLRPLRWHSRWHEAIHAKKSYDMPHAAGIIYQLVLVALVVFYLRS